MSDTQKTQYETRRRVPRRSYDGQVAVLLHGKFKVERGYQVGERGIMVSSARPLEIGTQVVLTFYIENALVAVRGVVRSVVPPMKGHPVRYGLEFLNLEFSFKRKIRNFVAAATRISGDVAA